MQKSTLVKILIAEIFILVLFSLPAAGFGFVCGLFGLSAAPVSMINHLLVAGFAFAAISMPVLLLIGILFAAYYLRKDELRRALYALCLPVPSIVAVLLYAVGAVGVLVLHKFGIG